jgi:hypothetical protein
VEELGLGYKKLAIDVVGARRKDKTVRSALLYVWEYTIAEPTEVWGNNYLDYEALERFGRGVLESHDIDYVGNRQVAFLGQRGLEVAGTLGDEGFSIRMVRRDRRHFEVRCIGPHEQPEWPCESAFTTFTIDEPPERPAPEGPRVLHLREPRFGLEFDAPDDSWLATGPHVGGGGAQLVWMWRKGDRGIDVQVMDFRSLPAEPSEEQFLDRHAEHFRKDGSKVVVGEARLGGEQCHHLKVTSTDGWHKDVFFLHRNSINYTMLITQRKRDAKLIARATNALRFTLLAPERERREALLLSP